VLRCNSETSPVPCASDEELDAYLEAHELGFLTAYNFIDYGDIKPFEGPLRQTSKMIEMTKLAYSPTELTMKRLPLKEHIVSLEDSLVQIMTEPAEFSFLNLENVPANEVKLPR